MTKANLYLNLPGINQVIFVQSRYLLPQQGRKSTLYVVEKDELNGQQPTIYHYNGSEYVMMSGGSGSGGMQGYRQLTKLGVVASPSNPRRYDMTIIYTTNFLRAPVEVLRLTAGEQDVIKTEIGFDNSDASDFISTKFIEFDGAMKLKMNYMEPLIQDISWVEKGTLLRKKMDLSEFKKVEAMTVRH